MASADVNLAANMVYLGYSVEMENESDYPTVLEYLNTFFTHPQAERADKIVLMVLRNEQMIALFHCDQESQAIETGRSLLAYERRSDLRAALLVMQAPLYVYLLQAAPEQTASEELTEFVWDVAQAIYYRKRRRLPSPATFGQLSEAFNQTWPKAVREQVHECWSAYAQEQNLLLKRCPNG
jgi:hypothetical protein